MTSAAMFPWSAEKELPFLKYCLFFRVLRYVRIRRPVFARTFRFGLESRTAERQCLADMTEDFNHKE